MKGYLKYLLLSILPLLMFAIVIFTFFNDSHYTSTIAKVTSVKETIQSSEGDNEIDQLLTLQVTNHKHKGETITIHNKFFKSKAYTEQYHKGDKVFLADNLKSIDGSKRDNIIAIYGFIFITLMMIIGGYQGITSIISLIFNLLISIAILIIKQQNPDIPLFLLALGMVIISSILTLLLVSGLNKKTLIAIISTIISLLATALLVQLAIILTDGKGIRYETITFLTVSPKSIFMASIVIGTLGAIMDITITISSSLYEIKHNNLESSFLQLVKAGRNISDDILAPMSNILLFAYLTGAIPMIVLYLRNYSPIIQSFQLHWSIEITRFLASGIGIILTIPITIFIAAYVLSKEKVS
ncbi:YibE/F family protein [Macrococcus equi]|uniref:YibE/F family protein n=1 Tax=Macrococcus equi TaxID=3395462 RepID=UPI0039BE2A03